MRKTFSSVAQDIASSDADTMILLGDIGVFAFRKSLVEIPDRVFNMGILEQSMISIAAGMARNGYFPIVHTIAPFLVERAHEQLKVDFGYQELPGNFVSVGASIDYASLGGTHHAPADVEILLGIPGFQICIPGHSLELEIHLRSYYRNNSPTYYRLSENSNSKAHILGDETVTRIEEGSKATVIAVGPFLERTLEAVSGQNLEIIYLNQVSSNTKLELGQLISNDQIFLVEPFYQGTLSRIVMESLPDRYVSIKNIGIPRNFIHKYGTSNQLEAFLGLDSRNIRLRILEQVDG